MGIELNIKMKGNQTRLFLTLILTFSQTLAFAQNRGADVSGKDYFLYGTLILAILVGFALLIQLSDSFIGIQAKRFGVSDDVNLSVLPGVGDLVGRKAPDYTSGQDFYHLKRGFNVNLNGRPEGRIEEKVQATTCALQPPNFIGMVPIPKVIVEVGTRVKAGDPLFYDKSAPEIMYCAPVSGEVIEVNRGAKRSIQSVVLLADKQQAYRSYELPDLASAKRETLVEFLWGSGIWPMFRQRPFNIVPEKFDVPRDIFVTTFDTAPLAPDLNLVVDGRQEAFQKGLDVLTKLTPGQVFLGLDARGKSAPHEAFAEASGVEKAWFSGKHPAGNVGIQIHHIKPLANADKVWTLGVQEVITLGGLFLNGQFDASRVIALSGAEIDQPRYVRTYQGARLSDLLKGQLKDDSKKVRLISGDVLSGQKKQKDSFLDFYDDQITVIQEGDYFEMFGWLLPLNPRPSISKTFPNWLFPKHRFHGDTNTHGEKRAFVVTGQYEQVLPMDIYPQHLVKSILVNDFERMEGLGINELVEEDIAICEFVCTSKQPLQQILRRGLDQMRLQG